MTIYLDLVVANITTILTEKGMWDDTIFIYASDNGGDTAAVGSGNNMPLRGRKSNYFEGGVRVPAFIYSKLLPSSCSVNIFFLVLFIMCFDSHHCLYCDDICLAPTRIKGYHLQLHDACD
jgi:hypothetical protein